MAQLAAPSERESLAAAKDRAHHYPGSYKIYMLQVAQLWSTVVSLTSRAIFDAFLCRPARSSADVFLPRNSIDCGSRGAGPTARDPALKEPIASRI